MTGQCRACRDRLARLWVPAWLLRLLHRLGLTDLTAAEVEAYARMRARRAP